MTCSLLLHHYYICAASAVTGKLIFTTTRVVLSRIISSTWCSLVVRIWGLYTSNTSITCYLLLSWYNIIFLSNLVYYVGSSQHLLTISACFGLLTQNKRPNNIRPHNKLNSQSWTVRSLKLALVNPDNNRSLEHNRFSSHSMSNRSPHYVSCF